MSLPWPISLATSAATLGSSTSSVKIPSSDSSSLLRTRSTTLYVLCA
ncbi:unnamed protein product [Ectocarpus sp. 13 AM-2016]